MFEAGIANWAVHAYCFGVHCVSAARVGEERFWIGLGADGLFAP
jgi:hypothetical protein